MIKFATTDVKWTDTIKDIKNKFYLNDQTYIEFEANHTRSIFNPIDTQGDESETIASLYLKNLTDVQKIALTSASTLDIWVKIKSRSFEFGSLCMCCFVFCFSFFDYPCTNVVCLEIRRLKLVSNMQKDFEIDNVFDSMKILRVKEKLKTKYHIKSQYMLIYTINKNGTSINECDDDTTINDIGDIDNDKNQLRIIIAQDAKHFIKNFGNKDGKREKSDKIAVFIDSHLYFVENTIPLQEAIMNNEELNNLLIKEERLLIKPPQIGGEILDLKKSLIEHQIKAEMELFTLNNQEKEYSIYCAYFVTQIPIKLKFRLGDTILDVKKAFLNQFKKSDEMKKYQNKVELDVNMLRLYERPYFFRLMGDLEFELNNDNSNDTTSDCSWQKAEYDRERKECLANGNKFWRNVKGYEAYCDNSRLANEYSLRCFDNNTILLFPVFNFNVTVVDGRLKCQHNVGRRHIMNVCTTDSMEDVYKKCNDILPNSIGIESFELVLVGNDNGNDNTNDNNNNSNNSNIDDNIDIDLGMMDHKAHKKDNTDIDKIEVNSYVEESGLFEHGMVNVMSMDNTVDIIVARANGVCNEFKLCFVVALLGMVMRLILISCC